MWGSLIRGSWYRCCCPPDEDQNDTPPCLDTWVSFSVWAAHSQATEQHRVFTTPTVFLGNLVVPLASQYIVSSLCYLDKNKNKKKKHCRHCPNFVLSSRILSETSLSFTIRSTSNLFSNSSFDQRRSVCVVCRHRLGWRGRQTSSRDEKIWRKTVLSAGSVWRTPSYGWESWDKRGRREARRTRTRRPSWGQSRLKWGNWKRKRRFLRNWWRSTGGKRRRFPGMWTRSAKKVSAGQVPHGAVNLWANHVSTELSSDLHCGFQSVFNIEAETAEEEEDAEKRRTFLETHGKEIKHFGTIYYLCMYAHIFSHIYVYIHIYVHYIYFHIYTHICLYIYMHIYPHI